MKAVFAIPFVQAILVLALFLSIVAGGRLMILDLRKRQSAAVSTLFYFFSLAFYLTVLVAWWAVWKGAITHGGNAASPVGEWLLKVMTALYDLGDEIAGTAALASVVVIPQVMSYLLSWPFGCASQPSFVDASVKFIAWAVAKSMAVCSGITAALLPFGALFGWNANDSTFFTRGSFFALMSLMVAFGVIWMLHAMQEILEGIAGLVSPRVKRQLARMHAGATRYRARGPGLPLA